MAPEPDARERAFYDHENAEPRRARRAAADWGVNEDIFDRMPSRLGRVERRPQHQEIVLRRDVDPASVAVIAEMRWTGPMNHASRSTLWIACRRRR